MFQPDDDPFKSRIKQEYSYRVGDRSFASEYAARQYLAQEDLVAFIANNGIAQQILLAKATVSDIRQDTEEMRDWITHHVHELLPILQLIAFANPKSKDEP